MIRIGSSLPYAGIRGRGPRLLDMRVDKATRSRPPPEFSGTVYLNGVKHTGLNSDYTMDWVKVTVSDGTVVEAAGPPPDPFPADEEWYEKANTYGDIHVTRFG